MALELIDYKSSNAKTIVVGMSGGVDSSVTAALLKQAGHNVIGLFMKNWEEIDDSGTCTAAQDFDDVAKVCEQIGIQYYAVNFAKEYWDNVFKDFLRDYQAGYTPNPDILCNREIKFKVFLQKAMELGADYLATGHYCQNAVDEQDNYYLLKGVDPEKDQSYFLYTLQSEILKKVLFPIGELPKSKVRKLASEFGLATQKKKDSTGICFIGERNFTKFLSQYLAIQPGQFRNLDGKVVGQHRGVAYYTLGQRRGLGLGGEGERWFVVKKDVKANVVYVERGSDHAALYGNELCANELSFVNQNTLDTLGLIKPFKSKIRYRQKDQDCQARLIDKGSRLHVVFNEPQRAITPRQSVVLYTQLPSRQNPAIVYDVCVGGGMIEPLPISQ